MKRGVAQQRAEGFARRGYRVYLYSRSPWGGSRRAPRVWSYFAYVDGRTEPADERARLERAGWRFEHQIRPEPPEPAQRAFEPW